jgi:hypothetical protein
MVIGLALGGHQGATMSQHSCCNIGRPEFLSLAASELMWPAAACALCSVLHTPPSPTSLSMFAVQYTSDSQCLSIPLPPLYTRRHALPSIPRHPLACHHHSMVGRRRVHQPGRHSISVPCMLRLWRVRRSRPINWRVNWRARRW